MPLFPGNVYRLPMTGALAYVERDSEIAHYVVCLPDQAGISLYGRKTLVPGSVRARAVSKGQPRVDPIDPATLTPHNRWFLEQFRRLRADYGLSHVVPPSADDEHPQEADVKKTTKSKTQPKPKAKTAPAPKAPKTPKPAHRGARYRLIVDAIPESAGGQYRQVLLAVSRGPAEGLYGAEVRERVAGSEAFGATPNLAESVAFYLAFGKKAGVLGASK